MLDYDVVVVGGGPAGAISALKIVQLGLDVLLVERGSVNRHKACGGILPRICVDLLSEALGVSLPTSVLCAPPALGLYYVPPSGLPNSGTRRNYRLININRDSFDQWLRHLAGASGVTILYDTEFLQSSGSEPVTVVVKREKKPVTVTTKYLIGADGVHSRVRGHIYGDIRTAKELVLQEHWSAEGNFKDYFYAFFSGKVSPAYAYVIPKDGLFVVGTGVPPTSLMKPDESITRFKEWLRRDFAFQPKHRVRRETWAIPYGFTCEGRENTILVGDAAGFCNSLSGEGIRLAIESGLAAGDAIRDTTSDDTPLAQVYRDYVEGLSSFIHQVHSYVLTMTDSIREDFVQSELAG